MLETLAVFLFLGDRNMLSGQVSSPAVQCQLGERSKTLLDPFVHVLLHPSQLQ